MPISVVCEGCGQKLKAADKLAGRTVACPKCQSRISIPSADEEFDPFAESPDDNSDPHDSRANSHPAAADDDAEDEEYRLAGDPQPRPAQSTFTSLNSSPNPAPSDPFDAAFAGKGSAGPAYVPKPKRRRPPARTPQRDAFDTTEFGAGGFDIGRYLYVLIAVTILPLAVHLLAGPDDTKARLEQTLQKHPELAGKEDLTRDDFLAQLPEHKIDGALFPYDTHMHWVIGGAAIVVFLGTIVGLMPRGGNSHPGALVGAGIFTGTVGLAFLFFVQFLAQLSVGFRGVRGKAIIIVAILWLIAFSYHAALDENMSFVPSLLGFMFGVGLCEELTKAFPIIFAQRTWNHDWRSACAWGFASGVGFGIAEGIHYSGVHYNGLEPLGVYLVRFISCVGLHAMWSASVGVMFWRNAELFDEEFEWTMAWPFFYKVLLVPMTLHALYDTLLKKDMQVLALATAVITFVAMAATIEWTAANEQAS